MIYRKAFTLLELIFVIVIMGIIGKFGTEFLAQAYKEFIFSNVNNTLQSKSAAAIELISKKLQYRIKDSMIVRSDVNYSNFTTLDDAKGNSWRIYEWIDGDFDGYRGSSSTLPNWSGFIDLNKSTKTKIISPQTNTTATDNLIKLLSYENSDINNSALYFLVPNAQDIRRGYGWDGNLTEIKSQNGAMHPIHTTSEINQFAPDENNFTSITEYYKLAWSAYAIKLSPDGNLTLYYDYQPWEDRGTGEGENYKNDAKKVLLMQDVDTFRFQKIGKVINIQLCIKSDLINGGYALCKEKTIF